MSHSIALLLCLAGLAGGPLAGSGGADRLGSWALEPVRRVAPPAVREASWARTPIDRFVLARLEAAALRPAPEASRRELIRRVTFDLTGLPPTPEAIAAFEADDAPDAYERLVDRLLASPRFGERQGQRWLDVVRFAETEGFEYDRSLPDAWRYRDWVIAACNDDMPYDRFVTAQLAGDEIAGDERARDDTDGSDRELLVAAGFHRLGAVRRNAGNQEVASSRNEVLTERTDIVGAVFLGLTLGCARCHDHKFDPISQADYYRMQAFLAASREHDEMLASDEEKAAWEKRVEDVQAEIARLKKAFDKADGEEEMRLAQAIKKAKSRLPPRPPTICTVRNDDEPTKIHVLERGEWDKKGEPVGMRVLAALAPDGAAELPLDTAQPRTRLARWLTDPAHPLTARVVVNRLWQHHFGRGIVSTANDFGVNGARPSHPALLDWLAGELVRSGWRLKPLHRLMVLSSAYRQSSRSPLAAEAEGIDDDNALLWRFPRRRLEAEELRDAMLAVSGALNLQAGGPSVIVPVEQGLVDLLYEPSQWTVTEVETQHARRSVYLIAKRNLRLPFMEVFDQPALQTSCARRESSTHAPQALELLNGPLSNELATVFAARLRREAGDDPARIVARAFELAAGRAPSPGEAALAREFLRDGPLEELALAVFNLNAFLYVE